MLGSRLCPIWGRYHPQPPVPLSNTPARDLYNLSHQNQYPFNPFHDPSGISMPEHIERVLTTEDIATDGDAAVCHLLETVFEFSRVEVLQWLKIGPHKGHHLVMLVLCR
jgi:hypothetical protein